MRVLIIGSGGREHAIGWKLSSVAEVITGPGNPGAAQNGLCLAAFTEEDYLALAERHRVTLTVIGPEAPLVAGVVDKFKRAGHAIVGPTASAARLEGSKAFTKDFLQRHHIPTARHITVTSESEGRKALKQFPLPVVLKADGLAAGKGVIIAHTTEEAERALLSLLSHRQVVVEEFLQGEELSFIALCDGKRLLPLPPSQDHKAVYDDDQGPNTGGMGAYSDSRLLTPTDTDRILETIMYPALRGMAAEGSPFSGFLYAGLMMTVDGPKVLEFNVRLGDPETQAILCRVNSQIFLDVLLASAEGDLSGAMLDVSPDPALCVVLAAHGYPGTVRTGDPIEGIDAAEALGVQVFHAGTAERDGTLYTAGGRVLGVAAPGGTLADARDRVYHAIQHIRFDGMHYRKDIGAKGLKRYNRDRVGT